MVAVGAQAAFLAVAGRVAESYVSLDCPIRVFTGFQCPGCGSTRCLSAVSSGNLFEGAKHNPLLFVVLFASVSLGLLGVVSPQRVKSMFAFYQHHQARFAMIALAVTSIFTFGRNIVA